MKIIKIEKCGDCPFIKQYMECAKTRLTINDYPKIPHWCPLEEQQVKNLNIPDVIKSVCEMCEEEKELQSDNLCKECYDSLPS